MTHRKIIFSRILISASLTASLLAPGIARACSACGCGLFDVATSAMLPQGQGGMAYVQYDFENQDKNWSGSSSAAASANPDKDIRTDFVTTGVQYMFNRAWGMEFEAPYDYRSFRTTGGASGDDIVTVNWSGLGDVRLKGIYAGFSPDMSVGVTFGVKLPTGSYTRNDAFGDVDRDTEFGTGSTDALLGGFYRRNLTRDGRLTWFTQAELELPVLARDQYRPGDELDAASGVYFTGWSAGGVKITPVAQAIASDRGRDSGSAAADPVGTGGQRILLSPGIELNVHPLMVYADVELPVYQHLTGNQLVPPVVFKLVVGFMF